MDTNPSFNLAHSDEIFNLKFISPTICMGFILLTEGAFLS